MRREISDAPHAESLRGTCAEDDTEIAPRRMYESMSRLEELRSLLKESEVIRLDASLPTEDLTEIAVRELLTTRLA